MPCFYNASCASDELDLHTLYNICGFKFQFVFDFQPKPYYINYSLQADRYQALSIELTISIQLLIILFFCTCLHNTL